MDKTTQDLAWRNLPKEFKEEVKDIYSNAITYHPCGYNHKTDLLKYLFGHHNLTSDEKEEDEMLYVSRKQIGALQGEIFKAIMDAHDANEIVADLALTRLLAGLYSLQPPEVADKLIKLHYDNLRHSVREIRENKNTDKDGN